MSYALVPSNNSYYYLLFLHYVCGCGCRKLAFKRKQGWGFFRAHVSRYQIALSCNYVATDSPPEGGVGRIQEKFEHYSGVICDDSNLTKKRPK